MNNRGAARARRVAFCAFILSACASTGERNLSEATGENTVPPQECTLDGVNITVTETVFTETVIRGGKFYTYDGLQNWMMTETGALESKAHYGTVCAHKPPGETCKFDSIGTLYLGGQLTEVIDAYGRWFSFNHTAGVLGSGLLESQPPSRYQQICDLKPAGTTCQFDTRTYYNTPTLVLEAITAYGKVFNFDVNNGYMLHGTADIEAVPRFQPICANKPEGTLCKFDDREFYYRNSVLYEKIMAYGKYYNLESSVPAAEDPSGDVNIFPRYTIGPCAPRL